VSAPQPGGQYSGAVDTQSQGPAGGRPRDFDTEDYKNRNVVERSFNKFKDWRGLATRYEKYAQTYRGGMVLASIVLWLS